MLRRLIPLLLLPLFGCASNPATQSPTASPVRQEQKQSAIPAAASTLPPVELTADLLLRFLAGDIAVQRGQTDLGAAAWLDIAQSTRDPRTAKRATELAVSSAQLNLALEASKLWIDSTPSDQDAQRIQLSLLIRANRLKDVEPLLVQTKIDDTEAWRSFFIQLHLLWSSKADPAEVRRLTLLLCQGHERLPEARFALATLHATQNREKQALSELDAALGLRPWWEPAVLYKGQLLQQSGQNKSAISLLNQAARHNPTQRSFALALARLLHADQQSAAAQTVYTEFLAQRPNDSEALLGAAEIALQSNDYNSAYDLLLRVSALPSTNQSLL